MWTRTEGVRVKTDGKDLPLDDFKRPGWWRRGGEILEILERVSCHREVNETHICRAIPVVRTQHGNRVGLLASLDAPC